MSNKPDPTRAAIQHVNTITDRLDDLRKADLKLIKAEIRRIDEVQKMNFEHSKELREAESKRIDANRSGDNQAVQVANERGINSAAILAKQVNDSAQMLAIQLNSMESKLSDRILSLEKFQSSNTGKTSVINTIVAICAALLSGLAVYIFKK